MLTGRITKRVTTNTSHVFARAYTGAKYQQRHEVEAALWCMTRKLRQRRRVALRFWHDQQSYAGEKDDKAEGQAGD
jgi:hypothetical protein